MKNQNSKTINTFYIETYGCAMNIADSERFKTILRLIGLKEAEALEVADLIVFNSCSVRQKAEDRIYGLAPKIEKLKVKNPELTTVLTGCMARRKLNDNFKHNTKTQRTNKKRAEEIKQSAPWLDLVIETKQFHKINGELEKLNIKINGNIKDSEIFQQSENEFLNVKRTPDHKYSAGITISHGCDHMCTFCIVPYARGREVCRNYEPIIEEVQEAIEKGAKDIMLLGQTVNRWINPKYTEDYYNTNRMLSKIENINKIPLPNSKEPKDFLQLLQKIDALEGDFWLSFISSHPNYYTKELIDLIANSAKTNGHLRPFIHLALQSGNNEILRRMRRNHTIEEFIEKVEYMKSKIPEATITTDIIVGFPGETNEQFQETLSVCNRLEFDQIYISEYSERDGTGASFMKDDILHETKEARKYQLNELLKKTALKNNKKLLNSIQKVLITSEEDSQIYKGRTRHNKLIRFKSKEPLKLGQFINIKVTSVISWALEGESQT